MGSLPDYGWQTRFELGIPTIDHQHQYFFLLIQRISKYVNAGDDDKVKRLIEELFKYTQFHFKSEENMMAFNDYPHLKKHESIHVALIEELNNSALDLEQGAMPASKFLNFLVRWLTCHTTSEDKAFAKFYHNDKS